MSHPNKPKRRYADIRNGTKVKFPTPSIIWTIMVSAKKKFWGEAASFAVPFIAEPASPPAAPATTNGVAATASLALSFLIPYSLLFGITHSFLLSSLAVSFLYALCNGNGVLKIHSLFLLGLIRS